MCADPQSQRCVDKQSHTVMQSHIHTVTQTHIQADVQSHKDTPFILHRLITGSCSSCVCLHRHLARQVLGSKSLLRWNQNSPTSSGRDGIQANALHLQPPCLQGTRMLLPKTKLDWINTKLLRIKHYRIYIFCLYTEEICGKNIMSLYQWAHKVN